MDSSPGYRELGPIFRPGTGRSSGVRSEEQPNFGLNKKSELVMAFNARCPQRFVSDQLMLSRDFISFLWAGLPSQLSTFKFFQDDTSTMDEMCDVFEYNLWCAATWSPMSKY